MEKKENAGYTLKTTSIEDMAFSKAIPCSPGKDDKTEIAFVLTDVSQEETNQIVATISIDEAKEMIKGLKSIIDEVENE
jgi:hypothetical protein